MPTVTLCGNDSPKGGNQVQITAQVDLCLLMNGETIAVPTFVLPDSTQDCLLGNGTNACQYSDPLGFKFCDGKGKPLRTDPSLF